MKFSIGDIVMSVIGDHRGQVLDSYKGADMESYTVRFSIGGVRISNDKLKFSPLSIVEMRDYELQKVIS